MNLAHPELSWSFAATVITGAACLFVAAALLSAGAGRLLIPWLVRRKLNDGEQRKASDYLNMLHADKKNTPTMGGAFLVPAMLMTAVVGGGALTQAGAEPMRVWSALGAASFAVLAHAGLGLWDDYCKLTRRGKDGISGKKKLAAQTLIATLACTAAYLLVGDANAKLLLPFAELPLGVLMVPLGVFVVVGASNAYNLTDGLDGLAGGTGAIAFYALGGAAALLAIFGGTDPSLAWSCAVLGVSASGALLGFLFWNRHPAKVFMGDTGSLSLGALLGFIAVLGRLELVLAVAGGVFVAEAGSVMLQVAYFKATKGKRIFRCSPLHHHYQFGGRHESQVTSVFWKAGMACAALALALLPITIRQPETATLQPMAEQPTRDAGDAVVQR
ncbi:MAG: phospho-N-acetylmuramoyl-pentapeptide-transferase [Planctomycetes bacterium]|nr:phospho-N-acetylmuramoyl-pentapeptide-transferase [Planctomycetota bacterium]MCB9934963.1 phospho-N-acetylmuramoyl-pentapeptide-transferase [Planctomycetota bacterium]